MKKIIKSFNSHWYFFTIILIIIIAGIIRFYSFNTSWGIGGTDTPRDIMISSIALHRHELPLIGPFSSAGPFVTGPLYFWILMPAMLFLPFSLSAPFIYFIMLSLLFILIMILLGKYLVGEMFSLLLGIIVTFSPESILSSYTLNNPNLVPLFTALSLLFFVMLIYKQKWLYALLMGLSVGITISLHYQGLNLLIMIPLILAIYNIKLLNRLFSFLLSIIGLIITFIPIMIWDSQQGFANIRNVLDYFLIGQYRMYVPNSWKIFLLNFMPDQWAKVIGGFYIISLVLMIFTLFYISYLFIKFKKQKLELELLAIIFVILIVVNRFYHGLRQESYVLYFSPFILLFSTLAIYYLFITIRNKFKNIPYIFNILGGVFILLVLGSGLLSIENSFIKPQYQMSNLNNSVNKLTSLYPHDKFLVFDYKNMQNGKSMLLSLELYRRGLEAPQGVRIGTSCDASCAVGYRKLNISDLNLVEIPKIVKISQIDWVNDNADNNYDLLIGWSKKHLLKSSFDLSQYLKMSGAK